jgi:hypothetical protein
MSGFTDLSYDPTTEVQRSGMGNRWGDVYAHLTGQGRVVVGGRINDVGLGLALGGELSAHLSIARHTANRHIAGGLSHLSSKYGWVSQSVVSYEVMLANGTHVTASATENPDLYFGNKAAGNNFGKSRHPPCHSRVVLTEELLAGIVTHLNQRTYPLGKVWGGTMVYSAAHAEDFMAALAEYQAHGQLDKKSSMLPYLAVTNDTILSTFLYQDGVERPDAFAPFYDIPSLQDGTKIYNNFHEFAESGLPGLPRQATQYPRSSHHEALG